jgi:hypothetical protein
VSHAREASAYAATLVAYSRGHRVDVRGGPRAPATGRQLATLTGHTSRARAVTFTLDGGNSHDYFGVAGSGVRLATWSMWPPAATDTVEGVSGDLPPVRHASSAVPTAGHGGSTVSPGGDGMPRRRAAAFWIRPRRAHRFWHDRTVNTGDGAGGDPGSADSPRRVFLSVAGPDAAWGSGYSASYAARVTRSSSINGRSPSARTSSPASMRPSPVRTGWSPS